MYVFLRQGIKKNRIVRVSFFVELVTLWNIWKQASSVKDAYLSGYIKILAQEFNFLLLDLLIFAHLDKGSFTSVDVLGFCEAETELHMCDWISDYFPDMSLTYCFNVFFHELLNWCSVHVWNMSSFLRFLKIFVDVILRWGNYEAPSFRFLYIFTIFHCFCIGIHRLERSKIISIGWIVFRKK